MYLLVDRRQVVERHAGQLHLEQLVHRQLAARVGQADDDAIDVAGADDRRNVLDRADDAGVDHRRADARRVGIDEADDLDAELLPALEQLARQADRGGPVPTSSSRSRGAAWPMNQSNTRRQPTTAVSISTDDTTKTPRPMMRPGDQK